MRVQVQIVRRDPVNDDLVVLADGLSVDTDTSESDAELGSSLRMMLRRVERNWEMDENGQLTEIPRVKQMFRRWMQSPQSTSYSPFNEFVTHVLTNATLRKNVIAEYSLETLDEMEQIARQRLDTKAMRNDHVVYRYIQRMIHARQRDAHEAIEVARGEHPMDSGAYDRMPEPTSDCASEEEHYAAIRMLGECPWCGQSDS